MSNIRAAQVFASVKCHSATKNNPMLPTPNSNVSLEPAMEREERRVKTCPGCSENVITVCATGELHLPPDRCKVLITMSSKKDQVQDVKNSIARRMDYIKQTLHNNNVKEGDISTSKVIRRVDGLYHLDAELIVLFVDPTKCQDVCNFLVEKLDESVKISLPEFSHGPQYLENLRRQASLLGVSNAKQKAVEIAKFLHATVGNAVSIREDSLSEWEGSVDSSFDPEAPSTVQQRRDQATMHVNVKVTATFEMRPKKGKTIEK